MRILKLKDMFFKGFVCDKCGRELKHAFSINGKGIYGKECVLSIAGYKIEKKIKEQMIRNKIWNKIINHPQVYNLTKYIQEYGDISIVRDNFFQNGYLS